MVAKPYTLRGGVVYRIRYFALPGCLRRRASVLVLTAVIYLEGVPVLELKSGPMTSPLARLRHADGLSRLSKVGGEIFRGADGRQRPGPTFEQEFFERRYAFHRPLKLYR